MRCAVLFLISVALLWGETFRLYLKEGGFHLTNQYQVQGDRVRYYSTERGDWEEIPLALLDLHKTEDERKIKAEETTKDTRSVDEEEKAERDLRKEIASVPLTPGAYFKRGEKVEPLEASDYQVITDKKRKILQVITPVPLVPGKALVVIKGDHAKFTVGEDRPEFYFRRTKLTGFGILKVTPGKKNTRILENLSIAPVVNMADERRKEIPIFQQDLGNGLFKVWPEKPLESGEYAIVQYGDSEDPNEIDLQVWDFALRP